MIYAAVAAAALVAAIAGFYGCARLRGWRIGKWSWPLRVGHGACRRCTTTWMFARPHITPYDVTDRGTTRGMFPLCERCWIELGTAEARYPFYADLMLEWLRAYEASGNSREADRVRRAGVSVSAALQAGL